MSRQNWTREQLTKALALYCQMPFGKMHSRNPTIVALAEEIGRTPAAVAMKLVNFASLDPELRGRGVGGMANTSAADREIWSQYYGRWDTLANALVVPEPLESQPPPAKLPRVPTKMPTGPTQVERLTKQRRGQSFFRNAVIAAHEGRCCITGITSPALLRASHIVPWSHDPSMRLDPRNGLCLNALHDAAFDRGLITLSATLELQVSKRVKKEVPEPIYREMFASHAGTPIKMPERFQPTGEMLAFHRANVFVA